MMRLMNLNVNGREYRVEADPSMRLLVLIRDVLCRSGTIAGWSEGVWGACTVILDGEAVTSCLLLAGQAEGRKLVTIEGVRTDKELSRLQKAFIEYGAVQCGFCTPGMIMSAKALLDRNPHPTEDEIRTALSGNLCRCTGYKKIVEAVQAAAEEG